MSDTTLTTTGQVRNALAQCLVRVKEGTLNATDAKAVIGLANQITTSIAVELKHSNLMAQLGQKNVELGSLEIK